jgi:DNA mismatch repair protein MutS
VGASDNLSRGQSTFMVEMLETANILNNATDKSFIILDELGRGTSTYDGIAIAWAVAEYILQNIKAKTLFATHYFELTDLEKEFPQVKNKSMSLLENEKGIIFLYKIKDGIQDKSYGVEVAKLGGLPQTVINRAKSIQKELELKESKAEGKFLKTEQISFSAEE